jgi:heterodisulfide reductase subunit C
LWYSVRESLLANGEPTPPVLSPFSFARGLLVQEKLSADDYALPIEKARMKVAGRESELTNRDYVVQLNPEPPGNPYPVLKDDTFSHCFSCQSCTAVCPVVGNFDHPEQVLDLLPHQIMGCLGLGLTEMAAGARMIWDCLTCYKCQENCPQQVEVCDLLFDLKNTAVRNNEDLKYSGREK